MIKLFQLCILLTFVYACGSQGGSKSTMIKGYETLYHNQTGDELPEIGDYVFFTLDVYDNEGGVVSESPMGEQMPVIQILSEDQIPDKGNPVIELMSSLAVGDSATMNIPLDSIPNPPPNMVGKEYILYAVRTHRILGEEEYMQEAEAKRAEEARMMQEAMAVAPKLLADIETQLKTYMDGGEVGKVTEGPGGMKIIMIEEGEGPTANDGQFVSVMYAGYLKDLSPFDNSYNRGMPFEFNLGRGSVIEGWDKGVPYLNVGAKAILDIPFQMAYGAAGRPPSIPAESDLLFYVELKDIK